MAQNVFVVLEGELVHAVYTSAESVVDFCSRFEHCMGNELTEEAKKELLESLCALRVFDVRWQGRLKIQKNNLQ